MAKRKRRSKPTPKGDPTLARDGKPQEAIRHLEAALKLNPSFQQARRALAGLTSSGAK